jgi:hypothetical protein
LDFVYSKTTIILIEELIHHKKFRKNKIRVSCILSISIGGINSTLIEKVIKRRNISNSNYTSKN